MPVELYSISSIKEQLGNSVVGQIEDAAVDGMISAQAVLSRLRGVDAERFTQWAQQRGDSTSPVGQEHSQTGFERIAPSTTGIPSNETKVRSVAEQAVTRFMEQIEQRHHEFGGWRDYRQSAVRSTNVYPSCVDVKPPSVRALAKEHDVPEADLRTYAEALLNERFDRKGWVKRGEWDYGSKWLIGPKSGLWAWAVGLKDVTSVLAQVISLGLLDGTNFVTGSRPLRL